MLHPIALWPITERNERVAKIRDQNVAPSAKMEL